MPKTPHVFQDVKAVTFESCFTSEDGELVIFAVRDRNGTKGTIALDWRDLGITCQLIARGTELATKRRRELKKSDRFTGEQISPQLVDGFQVSELPDQKLKVLTLQSVAGLRCDFAIPMNKIDQRGRSLPRAIAEELLSDTPTDKSKLQ